MYISEVNFPALFDHKTRKKQENSLVNNLCYGWHQTTQDPKDFSKFSNLIKENRIKNKEPKVSGHKNQKKEPRPKRQGNQVAVFAVTEETRAAVHRAKTEDLEPAGRHPEG